jgi:hypothetical protein
MLKAKLLAGQADSTGEDLDLVGTRLQKDWMRE